MGKMIAVILLLGIIVAAASVGLYFGSWIFKLSSIKTMPYVLGCFIGVPLVAAAVAIALIVMPVVGVLSSIFGRGK